MKKQNNITGSVKLFEQLICTAQGTSNLSGDRAMDYTSGSNPETEIFKQHKQGFFLTAMKKGTCLLFRPITPHSCKHHHHQNTAKQLAGDAGPNPTIVFHYSLPVTRNRREFRMGILPALRRVQCSGLKKGGAMK